MERETPFLIWTPDLSACDDIDAAFDGMIEATDLLDHALYQGEAFDSVLDCLAERGYDALDYLDYCERNLSALKIVS